ncbi:unnamed protein product [Darwinula stevensoni]|uniref:Mediator of RNA polymerase II transcription subunit 18 n=1 Tax=Darwinula stevensoni TaxID=69355 RepID=A0A7R8X9N4_9CRUS|nr:unnamed protein product [Darwinula stevensoni]CAG0890809.1 unnamed protein product [Darwinula stevensoni]
MLALARGGKPGAGESSGTQDPLPTEVFPPGSPGPLENVIILAPVCIAVVTLLGVFLGVLLSQRQRKPISHRLPFIRIPTSETPCPDDEKMKILLVYNPDNSAFSHLVSAFVQFLTSSGLQVENCCSDEGGKEMTPEELLRILGDLSWSILLVSSMEAKIQQEALLEAQLVENISQSHYMVSNFRYVLWNILDNPVLLKDYTRVSLVRFSEVTADKDRLNFVTPLKEFLVPSHVDDLLQKLQRVTSHGTENEGRHNWSKEMWCHFEALCIQAKAAAAFMQRNKGMASVTPEGFSMTPAARLGSIVPNQEYFIQGSILDSNRDVLIHRLKGLCDNVDSDTENFHEHEMIFTLQLGNMVQQHLTLRVRRALDQGLDPSTTPWMLRYCGTTEYGDGKSRVTPVRSSIDVACTCNVVEFLNELGFKLDFEYMLKGQVFRKGRMKITLSKIFRETPKTQSYSHKLGCLDVGTWRDQLWPDDWTSVTQDGKLSAQFEHTLLVTDDGCDVLTRRLTEDGLPHFMAKL